MFKESCHIQVNSKDARTRLVKELREIGYEPFYMDYEDEYPHYIFTTTQGTFSDTMSVSEKSYHCGTNEDLFLAVAALSYGTDNHQWFKTIKGNWFKSNHKHQLRMSYVPIKGGGGSWKQVHKKASLSDLVKHFTK